jgi:hypothetical protein
MPGREPAVCTVADSPQLSPAAVGLISSPQNIEVLIPVPVNMAFLGNKVFADIK